MRHGFIIGFFLYCLSWVYRLITIIRNYAYDRGFSAIFRSNLPVVSVGNISVGGNAKTPLCIFLAEQLKAKGFKPVILTRGYGGNLKGPLLVQATHTYTQVGDEPCLLAQVYGLSVVVARDRVAGARFIEAQEIGNLIILDDGFQHRRLDRNVDIVTINVGTEEAICDLVESRLLPYGRLRELREPALKRADIVVLAYRRPFTNQREVDQRIIRVLPANKRACRSFLKPLGVHKLSTGQRLEACEVLAFCAIANPQAFQETLKDLGFKLREFKTFGDHHKFSTQDLISLSQKSEGLPLVCTEKDAVKLSIFSDLNLYALKSSLEVIPTDAFLVQVIRGLET